jgi:hypothetical protein
MIQVHAPQVSVMLYKIVVRKDESTDPDASASMDVDITPYLGEGSSVTTHRAINSPGNGFSIRLSDQLLRGKPGYEKYSIYDMVEPMDVVEIRMSRVGNTQLVMRGLVTDTSLDQSIDASGKPTRIVTITGGDYGCFLRMMSISYFKGSSIGLAIAAMTKTYMSVVYGIPVASFPAGDFVTMLVNEVINDFIGKFKNDMLPFLDADVTGADAEDMVHPLGVQSNPEGTLWDYLHKHGNLGPFYELLFEDEESYSRLVYRKPAFKSIPCNDTNGTCKPEKFIFNLTDADVGSFDIAPNEIISIRRARSEHDVANWYMVRSATGELRTDQMVTRDSIVGDGTFLSKGDYPNCHEDMYGIRPMEVSTEHGSLKTQATPGQKEAEFKAGGIGHADYMKKQIKYLQDSNIDNVLFESGSIRCNGNPIYKPGCHFAIDWGNANQETGYVTSVTHTFEVLKGYTCTLQFSRGTGFVWRRQAKNPYFYGRGIYA